MRFVLTIWCLHLILLPIYVFGSGSIQPSHIVLITGLLTLVLSQHFQSQIGGARQSIVDTRIAITGRLICTIFCLFALYVCTVNSAWAAILSSAKPFLFSSFQIYNLLLVYFVFSVASKGFFSFARYTRAGFSGALILISVSILYDGYGSASRESGLFNNPNQLAFFCLSSSLCFYIVEKLGIGSSLWNRSFIGISCFICMLTLSRAGLSCCVLVFLASLFDGPSKLSKSFIILVTTTALLIFAGSIGIIESLEKRNQQTQAVFDNQIEGRGYDRILESPEYILLGAGEGENRRFEGFLASLGGEIHSSVGTLIFCYGIIGFSLYSCLWWFMFFASPGLVYKICAAAPIIFSVTHNGLRFSAGIIAVLLMTCGGIAFKLSNEDRKNWNSI